MSIISFTHKGDFSKTNNLLKKLKDFKIDYILEKYAKIGLKQLELNTPRKTGKTAASWSYEIQKTDTTVTLYYKNSNVNKGVPIALVLQYGHGTRNGGYVKGIDYINPSLKPVFEKLVESCWKEVTS